MATTTITRATPVSMVFLGRGTGGRAECGDFTPSFSHIKHNADFGDKVVCKFMLAKGSEILLSAGEFEDSFVGEIHVGPQSGTHEESIGIPRRHIETRHPMSRQLHVGREPFHEVYGFQLSSFSMPFGVYDGKPLA